jgi:hypothetical protein
MEEANLLHSDALKARVSCRHNREGILKQLPKMLLWLRFGLRSQIPAVPDKLSNVDI